MRQSVNGGNESCTLGSAIREAEEHLKFCSSQGLSHLVPGACSACLLLYKPPLLFAVKQTNRRTDTSPGIARIPLCVGQVVLALALNWASGG